MGALGGIIGGLGQSALQYGEAQRHRNLQQWSLVQSHLANLISEARKVATTSERQADLLALQSKVLKARPGEDPTKLLEDVQSHLFLHPAAEKALTPQPITTPPGPAGPGQTPGTVGLPAAQPGTSPVQPVRQQPVSQAGGSPNGTPTPGIVGMESLPTPAPPPPPQAQQASPFSSMIGSSPLTRYNEAMAAGYMPGSVERAAQPYLTNAASLAHQQEMDQYVLNVLGPQKLAKLESMPGFSELNPMVQAAYRAEAAGLPAVNLPSGYYLPHTLSSLITADQAPPDATDFATGKPIHPSLGGDPNATYTVKAIGGKEVYVPVAPPQVTAQTPNGIAMYNKYGGGQQSQLQGAVPPSTNNIQRVPTAGGGYEFVQPSQMGVGTTPVEIPDAVNPAMLTSQRSVATTQTEGGSTSTTTSRKIPPVGGAPHFGAPLPPVPPQRQGGSAPPPPASTPAPGQAQPPAPRPLGYRERGMLDREISQYSKRFETMFSGAIDQLDKIEEAKGMVSGGAVQQALGVPKVLSALVSGKGSGVRITQAELDSVAHARGLGGDFESFFSRIAGQGNLTPTQKQQLTDALNDVRNIVVTRKALAGQALSKIQGAQSREEIIKANEEGLRGLGEGGGVPPVPGAPASVDHKKVKEIVDRYK